MNGQLPDDAATAAEIPTGILKFEGNLTAEQLAMFRALWEAAANLTEPQGFRVWKAGVAHGTAAERERIRQGVAAVPCASCGLATATCGPTGSLT